MKTMVVSSWWEFGIRKAGLVQFWDVSKKTCLGVLPGKTFGCPIIRLSDDGKLLAVIEFAGRMMIVDVATRKIRQAIELGEQVDDVAISPDGKFVLVGGYDSGKPYCVLVHTENGQVTRVFDGHKSTVLAVAFSNDGKLIGTAERKGTVCVWATSRYQPAFSFTGNDHGGWRSVSLRFLGRQLVVGRTVYREKEKKRIPTVSWWNLETRRCRRKAVVDSQWKEMGCKENVTVEEVKKRFRSGKMK